MKPMTAGLVARAVAAGALHFEADIAPLLNAHDLHGVRIKHLLNHTHGLDGSRLVQVPTQRSDGTIDVGQLLAAIRSSRRLAPPGRMFNYGNLGAWLAAAVLERSSGKTYRELLREDLRAITTALPDELCPATGGALQLNARQMLLWVRRHSDCAECDDATVFAAYGALRSEQYELQGWHPRLERVCLGWNVLADGWFGQVARMSGTSMLVRFNPRTRAALVVTAKGEGTATAIASSLFAEAFSDFRATREPMLMTREEWAAIDPTRFTGTYANASVTAVFDVAANGSLRVRAYRSSDSLDVATEKPLVKRHLRAARNGLFISQPAEPLVVPYAHFLDWDERSRHRYVQVGRQLLTSTDYEPS